LNTSNDDAAYDSQPDDPILELDDRPMPSIEETIQYEMEEDEEEEEEEEEN
jgi:hypothetical protein